MKTTLQNKLNDNKTHLYNPDAGLEIYAHCGKKIGSYYSHDCFGKVNPGVSPIGLSTDQLDECDCQLCLDKHKIWLKQNADMIIKRLNRDNSDNKDLCKNSDNKRECFKCKKDFICSMRNGNNNCWCTRYPHMLELTGDSCMCKTCLEKELEELNDEQC